MSKVTKGAYGFTREVPLGYDAAIERVTATLKEQGFGVLTTIDVKDTLKKKIDRDFTRYAILGACNPAFAIQALSAEIDIGLLMPCNVVVYERPADGRTVVGILDPGTMVTLTGRADVEPLAKQVQGKLVAALEAV